MKIAKKLQSGSTVDCTVSKVDKKKKVITVTTNIKAVPAIESDGITLSNLTPGMLVSAKVRAVLPDGLLLTFLSYFTVSILICFLSLLFLCLLTHSHCKLMVDGESHNGAFMRFW